MKGTFPNEFCGPRAPSTPHRLRRRMLNPHRRRPPTSSLATNNARPLRRRIRFRGGAPLVINIPEPRLALSPAQPLRSSLRAAPLARSLDAELQLGAALSERRPFGVVSPIMMTNNIMTTGVK